MVKTYKMYWCKECQTMVILEEENSVPWCCDKERSLTGYYTEDTW